MDQQVNPMPVDQEKPLRKKINRRSQVIGSIIALLAVAGTGWLAWHLTHREAPPSPRSGAGASTTVGVAAVEQADIPVILDALGTVTAAATVTVRPQVAGVLQKIHFRQGQMVRAGDVLATIDPRQFEMTLMQATGQRQRDEAQLENARLTLQRFRTLLEQDSIARQEVDTQAALVKQLEGTIVTDRAAEGTARLNLGYSKVVAPISGRVGLTVVDAGNVVSTSDANGVAVITQVSPIDVQFAVPQDQVPEVQRRSAEGAVLPVTAFDRTRASVLDTGRFVALDNQVDIQTGTVRAKARFDNAGLTLFPSQFVNVQVLLRTIKAALVIPVTALRHGSNGDFVYVLNQADKTVSLRQVKRGQASADMVEITAGLKPGEKVITEGGDRLKDGAKVTLPGDKPAGGDRRKSGSKRNAGAAVTDTSSTAADAPARASSGKSTADAGANAAPAGGTQADAPPRERRRRPAETPAP